MATLPTNLKDDILDARVNQRRRYNMITNPDGTVEFEDVTVYSQVGSEYGAGLINETNKQINGKVDDSKIVRDLKTIGAMTQEGFIPDALALKEVNESLENMGNEVLIATTTNTSETTFNSVDLKPYRYFYLFRVNTENITFFPCVFTYEMFKSFKLFQTSYVVNNTDYGAKVKYTSDNSIELQALGNGTAYLYGVK